MANLRKNQTPFYTEAQSKRWLSWLARGMQLNGQTVFMIEQLQPSWLLTHRQRAVYTFTSRLMAGLVYGLIFGIGSGWLCSYTPVELVVFIFHGLLGGFTFGMTIACFDLYRFNRGGRKLQQHEVPTGWQHVVGVLIVGVVFGLTAATILVLLLLICALFSFLSDSYVLDASRSYWISASTVGLISAVIVIGITSAALITVLRFVQYVLSICRRGNKQEQINPPTGWRHMVHFLFVGAVICCHLVPSFLAALSALIIVDQALLFDDRFATFLGISFTTVCVLAVVFSIICGMRQRKVECDIQTVETLNWSWARGRKGVLIGAPGLASGVFLAIWLAVTEGAADSQLIAFFLLFALFAGLIPGLFVTTVYGLRQGVAEMKASPNKGILLSMRSAAFMGVVCGLSVAVIFSLIPLMAHVTSDSKFVSVFPLKVAMILGLMSALIAGSWFGGLDVLNHYLLRWLLYLFGLAPLNYVHFLDYAAKDLNFLQKVGGGYIFIHRILLEHFASMEDEGMSKPQDSPPLAAPMLSDSVPGN